MKIEITENRHDYILKNLPMGECFEKDKNFYIKTDSNLKITHNEIHEIGCVNLLTGETKYFDARMWVIKENLKVVKDEEE